MFSRSFCKENILFSEVLEKQGENDIIQSSYFTIFPPLLKGGARRAEDFIILFFIIMINHEEKIFLRRNLVKFVIGLVLLGFSYSYIQNHPAEKSSIFSGFQILWQRVVVYYHKVTNTNSEAFQRKYDYEKTYQELINMAQNKACVDSNVLTVINETYMNLKKEGVKTLESDLPGYIRKANEYKNMIDNCTTK